MDGRVSYARRTCERKGGPRAAAFHEAAHHGSHSILVAQVLMRWRSTRATNIESNPLRPSPLIAIGRRTTASDTRPCAVQLPYVALPYVRHLGKNVVRRRNVTGDCVRLSYDRTYDIRPTIVRQLKFECTSYFVGHAIATLGTHRSTWAHGMLGLASGPCSAPSGLGHVLLATPVQLAICGPPPGWVAPKWVHQVAHVAQWLVEGCCSTLPAAGVKISCCSTCCRIWPVQ